MKIKRYKRVRRLLNFYKNSFSISAPFKIVADGTFCKAALDNKLNLREQLPIYFGGGVECQFFTTGCVLNELEALGQPCKGALVIARDYTQIRCKHPRVLSAGQCLKKLAGQSNERKYFFATQDPELTENLHKIPGCPVLFINYNCVLLERLSETSLAFTKGNSDARLNFEGVQKENLQKLLKDVKPIDENSAVRPKRKRKIKGGPNPLSCQKKKKDKIKSQQQSENSNIAPKKRRKRHKNGPTETKKVKIDDK